ncbi:C-Maf-inducing protein [Acanthosepion pharaonis]|uniref:C-Maf-inducing protein n=1 Tax=Acanthosepion pharaonis TaxID=158019 RepID=A0A812CTA7_ACAPH|nr:C-Maf-inducing protein [Sepia pharaonis]
MLLSVSFFFSLSLSLSISLSIEFCSTFILGSFGFFSLSSLTLPSPFRLFPLCASFFHLFFSLCASFFHLFFSLCASFSFISFSLSVLLSLSSLFLSLRASLSFISPCFSLFHLSVLLSLSSLRASLSFISPCFSLSFSLSLFHLSSSLSSLRASLSFISPCFSLFHLSVLLVLSFFLSLCFSLFHLSVLLVLSFFLSLCFSLSSVNMASSLPTGFMSSSIPYSSIEDIHTVSRWDAGHKFCIRITVQEGSVLLQKHVHKYEKLLKTARRPEVVVKEIKNMIDVSLNTPIHDTSVYQFPLELVSELLQSANSELTSKSAHENIIIALTPLLENNHPTQEICEFLIKHCKKSPRSSIVIDLFTPVAQRILKHNTDFGKLPNMRRFVQEYILALNSQNDGFKVVQAFVRNMHGQSSTCPHPRVLPNLVAVCLASIYSCYEEKKKGFLNNANISEEDWNKKLLCYIKMFETM